MTRFATPVDTATYGEYQVPADSGPLLRFSERIGTLAHPAEPGRYHLYAGWFCPWSQRVLITQLLSGLEDVVTVSYVDGARDGRGWAFREAEGPDPVNGFTLLREAYEATGGPGYDGHVSVPTLWDRVTGTVASNDYQAMGIDLATRFGGPTTYPSELAEQIDEVDAWLGPAVNHGVGQAARDAAARAELLEAFERLDNLFARRSYLVADQLTEADVRLWVTLVRYDVGPNATGAIGPRLSEFPHLWHYARARYRHPAFRATTRFDAFTASGATVPNWDSRRKVR
ncbi:MAG: glutathione S-transferase C-terminal domain-containing protein [Actinocatenispora sp.]